MTVTAFQEKVYSLLCTIPSGKVVTYKALSDALGSSPRAVGGALRNNPYAPEVPCHRVIATTGFIGGFKGDWHHQPTLAREEGSKQNEKLELLKEEGVLFDEKGQLIERERIWHGLPKAPPPPPPAAASSGKGSAAAAAATTAESTDA
ncbi:6-O-methylguanine DNA methyltransferase [Peziza echinospora]|nr:6-O-methylguanine DNA methyltransferase [Peziza echinospora]